MARLSKDQYFLTLTRVLSLRASCSRRNVGCALVDKNGHVLSTGYNGTPRGMENCSSYNGCPGSNQLSGEGLDLCQAVHAEQNALLQCSDVNQIKTAYITTAPCITCTKLLLNTSCDKIVFLDEYPTGLVGKSPSQELWESAGRRWEQYTMDIDFIVKRTMV